MNRKEIIRLINNEILPTAEIYDGEWMRNGKEIVANIIKAIEHWRIGKPADIQMTCRIIDGVLFINGESVKRVAAKLPRIPYSEEVLYWEGKCLRE